MTDVLIAEHKEPAILLLSWRIPKTGLKESEAQFIALTDYNYTTSQIMMKQFTITGNRASFIRENMS